MTYFRRRAETLDPPNLAMPLPNTYTLQSGVCPCEYSSHSAHRPLRGRLCEPTLTLALLTRPVAGMAVNGESCSWHVDHLRTVPVESRVQLSSIIIKTSGTVAAVARRRLDLVSCSRCRPHRARG